MQDQVIKLNATLGAATGPVATFLGSSQTKPHEETKAVNGDYLLVYVTPEKLACGFSSRLAELQRRKGIALVAVDEAHCVRPCLLHAAASRATGDVTAGNVYSGLHSPSMRSKRSPSSPAALLAPPAPPSPSSMLAAMPLRSLLLSLLSNFCFSEVTCHTQATR